MVAYLPTYLVGEWGRGTEARRGSGEAVRVVDREPGPLSHRGACGGEAVPEESPEARESGYFARCAF